MNDEISDHAAAYDFVQLGEGLADNLVRAAEEQVQRAQAILDQTKSMADIIRTQVTAQAKQIEEMNGRFKAFGEQMLDAHRKLNGDGPVIRERLIDHAADATAYIAEADTAKLRALDRDIIRGGRDEKHDPIPIPEPFDPANFRIKPKRPQSADGRHELPRAVATGEPYAPWARGNSENHRDPGVGTKQPDRD